ncbi:MAG: hypothetical protein GXY92_10825 [Syntrophomonadaceae bacterium]|nr:hypothetical protein [Syntrophomonadaceae bacterium]
MPMSKEDKLNFAFKVALAIAEEQKLVPPAELWMAKWDLSEDDIKRSHKNVKSAIDKLRGTQKIDYSLLELRIRDGKRFDVPTAQAIIGILYARGEFVDVIESLDFVPNEVMEYLEAAKRYYRPVRVEEE